MFHFKTFFVAASLAATAALPLPAMAQDQISASARLAAPGEMHERLSPLIGEWNIEMRIYSGPSAEPFVSTDLTATREWILGGRYVQEMLTGTVGGNPSERLAIIGYNNLDQRFELATFDTFEPGFMVYQGEIGDTSAMLDMVGESTEAGMGPEPTGRMRTIRYEIEITDTGSVERIFVRYPGEEEYLFVEQIFTPA